MPVWVEEAVPVCEEEAVFVSEELGESVCEGVSVAELVLVLELVLELPIDGVLVGGRGEGGGVDATEGTAGAMTVTPATL